MSAQAAEPVTIAAPAAAPSAIGAAGGSGEVKHLAMNPVTRAYLVRCCTPADPAVRGLADATATVGDASGMAVPIEQVGFLTILTRLTGVRLAVDVGTFTGLSALAIAQGVEAGGRVITCDVSDEYADLAHEHWEKAGVAERIEFRRGPALRTLAALEPGSADLVFIDADKMNYPRYLDAAVPALRPGGLLLADNVLLDGYVVAPDLADSELARRSALALRRFNAALAADERLEAVMLPIADGLTVARRR